MIVWLIVSVLVVYYVINFYQLIAGTYYVEETKLYKIDTFHLLGRAFEQSGNSGNVRYTSSRPKLVFESVNRYSFVIDRNLFQAITDRKKLEDTLMYHGLKFTVYSDAEDFEEYKKSISPISIRVYQLQIGDMRYIDFTKFNMLTRRDAMKGAIIPPAFILFFGVFLYKQNKDKNYWNKRRILLWCLGFIVTIISLLFLI
ncbi:hypothetical protein [Foetidibacter luteolus]|uniref:hypothetical protein n=1 Tax=Foetidibacter luteolus TaxID=2608880 RepID=UPI00129A2CAA|nr:hypothetical protein [Foetidibacter luteolus]